jgi:hypothetical protein
MVPQLASLCGRRPLCETQAIARSANVQSPFRTLTSQGLLLERLNALKSSDEGNSR